MVRSCVLHPTAVVLVLTTDFCQGSWMTSTDESLLGEPLMVPPVVVEGFDMMVGAGAAPRE